MIAMQNVLWLLVLIGVMILVHELGHFIAARYFDVRVDVFSFGFGPRLFGFKKGETDFRFSAILFGGYVKMTGEQPGEENVDDPHSYSAKPRWQRLIIASAGPFMNIVLAVGLLTGLYMVRYQKVTEPKIRGVIGHVIPDSPAAKAGIRDGDRITEIGGIPNPTWEQIQFKEVTSVERPLHVTIERKGKALDKTVVPVFDERVGAGSAGWFEQSEMQVGALSPGMPAENAGLRRGDLLVSANGQAIRSGYKLQEIIRGSNGQPVNIVIERGGKRQTITVQPVMSRLDGNPRWMIGVEPAPKVDIITTRLSLPDALEESVRRNLQSTSIIFSFLRGIIEHKMPAKTIEGPIRIAQLSGEAAREGPVAFIGLMSMISLNLAIFNLLPIPILDGGVILLLLIESTLRRDLSMPVKEAVLKLGFVFLMVVVAFALYNDISKIVG